MKLLILCVLYILVLAACEGGGPSAADPGARISGDSSLRKAWPSVETSCSACPKQQECPAPLTAVAEFLDSIGLPVTVVLKGTTQEQADQLRLAFGMPTREEAEKAVRGYLPRESFDIKTPCKRVGMGHTPMYVDVDGFLQYDDRIHYRVLYVPVLDQKGIMVRSVILAKVSGNLVVVYFRASDLVSSADAAYEPSLYYEAFGEGRTADDLVLVPGACTKEILEDQLIGDQRRAAEAEAVRKKKGSGLDYPVVAE